MRGGNSLEVRDRLLELDEQRVGEIHAEAFATTIRRTATSVASAGIVYAGTCHPPLRSWSDTWNTVNGGSPTLNASTGIADAVADDLERVHLRDRGRQMHGDVAESPP